MSTDVEVYQPQATSVAITERDIVDGWVAVVGEVAKLADWIAATDFVPKALRNKPAAIAACMLTGREIGIGPMQSMKVVHMVNGSPSLAAEFKRARAQAAGHEIVFEETTTTRCVVRGRRKGEDSWLTVAWSMDDAKRAKLAGKDVWQQHPRRMLEARASSELCDLKFPDCSWGLPTTEVLEDGGVVLEDGTIADAADAKAIEPPKQRTARRRQAPKDSGPAESAARTEVASPAGPATPPQPPLPGEDEPPAEPDDSTYDTPGTITPAQLTKLHTVFTKLDFGSGDRDQKLVTAQVIVGREIDSSKDLSRNEAKALIDTLEACDGNRERLIALLAEAEKAAGDDAEQVPDDGA